VLLPAEELFQDTVLLNATAHAGYPAKALMDAIRLVRLDGIHVMDIMMLPAPVPLAV